MRVRVAMLFPGEIVEATLVEAPSQSSRTAMDVRLELVGPPPVQLEPPTAMGAELFEATDAEKKALAAAGYQLKQVTYRQTKVTKAVVVSAVKCARCRKLAEAADPELVMLAPGRVDLGTGAAYAIEKLFGQPATHTHTCPDCRRVVSITEHRGMCLTSFPLDREV